MSERKNPGMSPEAKRSLLQSFKAQIDSFDGKASILLATLGIFIGLSVEFLKGLGSFGADCWGNALFVAFFCAAVAYVASACLCVVFALLAIFPRGRMYSEGKIRARKQTITDFDPDYYMHVAVDPDRFKKEAKTYDGKGEALDRQIIANARICRRKHLFLRLAIVAMAAFGTFYIAALALFIASLIAG